ncbi:hypothetical protein [Brucella intermedia]|uniref:hypothetical protein n=1 Tax=Brucella intermedia TaxID=94625 RepID=UPI00235ECB62|nr:hypothetical protein [Brucella intermedia]
MGNPRGYQRKRSVDPATEIGNAPQVAEQASRSASKSPYKSEGVTIRDRLGSIDVTKLDGLTPKQIIQSLAGVDETITAKICTNFVLGRPTQFAKAEAVKYEDAIILYNIQNGGDLFHILAEGNGANLGVMPRLPLGESREEQSQYRRIRNDFTKALCWQWQKDQIFAIKHPLSPHYYNGLFLVNHPQKGLVIMDPALTSIPGFRELPEDKQRLMLAERLDEMGESSVGVPRTLLHSMASAIKIAMRMPGADASLLPPGLLEELSFTNRRNIDETVVLNNIFKAHTALQKQWEKTGHGYSPKLLTALHLMHSRGDLPRESPLEPSELLEHLKTAWDATFLERPLHYDTKYPSGDGEMVKVAKGMLHGALKQVDSLGKKFEKAINDTLPAFVQGVAGLQGPGGLGTEKIANMLRNEDQEKAYREELEKHPWVIAYTRDSLRQEGKEVNEENLRARMKQVVAGFMPGDTMDHFIRHMEGYIYRLPSIPFIPISPGELYGTIKGLATGDDDLVLSSFPGTSMAYNLEMYRRTGDGDYLLSFVPVIGNMDDTLKSWKEGNYGYAALSMLNARRDAKQIMQMHRSIHAPEPGFRPRVHVDKSTFDQFPELKAEDVHKALSVPAVLAGADPSTIKQALANLDDPFNIRRTETAENQFSLSQGHFTENIPDFRDGKFYVTIDNQEVPVIWDGQAGRYRINEANSDSHVGIIDGKWGRCRGTRGIFSSCLGRASNTDPDPDNVGPPEYVHNPQDYITMPRLPEARFPAAMNEKILVDIGASAYIQLQGRTGWWRANYQKIDNADQRQWVVQSRRPWGDKHWLLRYRYPEQGTSWKKQWYPAYAVDPSFNVESSFRPESYPSRERDPAWSESDIKKGIVQAGSDTYVLVDNTQKWHRAINKHGDWMLEPGVGEKQPYIVVKRYKDRWDIAYAAYPEMMSESLNPERYGFQDQPDEYWHPADVQDGFITPDSFYVRMAIEGSPEQWYRGDRLGFDGEDMVIRPKDPSIGQPIYIELGDDGYHPVKKMIEPFESRKYRDLGAPPADGTGIQTDGTFNLPGRKKGVKLRIEIAGEYATRLYEVKKDPDNEVYRLVPGRDDDVSIRNWPVERIGETDEWQPMGDRSLVSIIDAFNNEQRAKIRSQQGGTVLKNDFLGPENTKISVTKLKNLDKKIKDEIAAEGIIYRAALLPNMNDEELQRANDKELKRAGSLIPSRPGSDPNDPDPYLRDIFRHSAAVHGSQGQVQSFTPVLDVAKRFFYELHAGDRGIIAIRVAPEDIKTMAGIIAYDSERLMLKGGVAPETVKSALYFILKARESETFYMQNNGNIPRDRIISIKDIDGNSMVLKDRNGKSLGTNVARVADFLKQNGNWGKIGRIVGAEAVADLFKRQIYIYNSETDTNPHVAGSEGHSESVRIYHNERDDKYEVQINGEKRSGGVGGDGFLQAFLLGVDHGTQVSTLRINIWRKLLTEPEKYQSLATTALEPEPASR